MVGWPRSPGVRASSTERPPSRAFCASTGPAARSMSPMCAPMARIVRGVMGSPDDAGWAYGSVQVDLDFEAAVPRKAHLGHLDVVHPPSLQCRAHVGGDPAGLLSEFLGSLTDGGAAAQPLAQPGA